MSGQILDKLKLRLSNHYREKLDELTQAYENGKEIDTLHEYEQERDQIFPLQEWLIKNSDQHEDILWNAILFPDAGRHFYNLREKHEDIRRWREVAIRLALQSGRVDIAAAHWAGLGTIDLKVGEYHNAIAYFERALPFLEAIKDHNAIGGVLYNTGIAYRYLAEYETALQYLSNALKYRQSDRENCRTLDAIGSIFLEIGEYEQAITFFDKALKIASEANLNTSLATILGHIGIVYLKVGRVNQSIHFLVPALNYTKEIADLRGQATHLSNLGLAYFYMENYEEAKTYYQEASDLAKQINDIDGQITALTNLGSVFRYEKDYVQARDFQKEALELAQNTQQSNAVASIYESLGNTYADLQDSIEAEKCYQKAIQISEAINNKETLATANVNLGILLRDLNQTDNALHHLRLGYDLLSQGQQHYLTEWCLEQITAIENNLS